MPSETRQLSRSARWRNWRCARANCPAAWPPAASSPHPPPVPSRSIKAWLHPVSFVRTITRSRRCYTSTAFITICSPSEPTPPKKPPPPKGGKEWKGPQFDAYGQPIGGGAAYTGVDKGGAAGAGFSADGDMFAGLRSLFGGGDDAKKKDDPSAEPSLDGLEKVPLGVYMYGGVGVGKSLLMDTFFDVAPIDKGKKRRIHFHEFMLEVHRRMHELRQSNPDMGDPIPYIAYDISVVTQLLCFDEFQVTDVADALVMRRLFRYLFAHGLVMVATSNRKPNDLYLNGIQRDSFLPFIDDLQLRCYSHDLASGTDYRTINAVDASGGTYMYPLDDSTRSRVDSLFKRLAKDDPLPGGKAAGPQTLRLRGRELKVPAAGNAVARFTFFGALRQAAGRGGLPWHRDRVSYGRC